MVQTAWTVARRAEARGGGLRAAETSREAFRQAGAGRVLAAVERERHAQIEARGADISEANTARIGRLNLEFHRQVAQASQNERLVTMLASAIEMPIVQQTFNRYSPRQLARSFAHHRELIDAFVARDGAWAKSVMSCHIHSAKQTLLGGAHDASP